MKRPVLLLVPLLATACAHRAPVALKLPLTPVERQIVNAIDSGDGDYEVRTLRARLDADPLDLTTRLALARRYEQLGFPEVALEHGRLACERAPDSEEAHLALAKMLRGRSRSGEAATLLVRFTDAHPASGARVWAWLGLLHDDAGDWKAGEAAHRKAIALEPGHDDLHNNLGYCLLRQGRQSEAAEEFETALRLNRNSVVARNNLGTSLTATPKQAVDHLQSVTDAASAHNNLAVAYIEAGEYAEARREIDLALGYNRQHSAALQNLELVSRLDAKPATVNAPAPISAEGRRSRMLRAWRHFWNGQAPGERPSSSPVASR